MRLAACAAAVLAAVALAACGGGSHRLKTTPPTEPPTYSATVPAVAIPEPTTPPPAADERVIRRWVDALRHGDIDGAARQFALPAVTQTAPGGPIVDLRTRAQARAFNAALPCGAVLVRTERQRGQGEPGLLVALFRLTERPGATCDGTGATASVGFLVERGRITHWLRLADTPR